MNQEEFEARIKEIHERVLSKALSPEEQNNYTESLFESLKHFNEYGQECWYARELSKVLDYKDFRNFELIIFKAMENCKTSGHDPADHFGEFTEMVPIGSNAKRGFPSYQLSRYACYLTILNADVSKPIIAHGKAYFAVKTRQQELIENFDSLAEDQKRLAIRREMKEHNKLLVAAAKDAGVETSLEYATFQNYGYMGLYGGLKAQDIKKRKNLKKSQDILDYMGYEELAANLFRATQTEAKPRRENIQVRVKLTGRTLMLVRKLEIPSKGLVEPCQKICLRPKKVLNKLNGNKNGLNEIKTAQCYQHRTAFT